ncbi:MAG: peptidoglycan editing factor PgeF [Alphaproteobacteria bacterium]|nr:peptidoglycan editing factor PgeF [Alphaproteobacteria bacterium]
MIQIDALGEGRIRHAFYTRRGGVSGGIYNSLNCGIGSRDDPDKVRSNRARTLAALDLPPDALATCRQIHSATCVTVTGPVADADRTEADALVTNTPGVALGVLTADCAPVLLVDPGAGVIGAAHAGWKGALTGIIDAAIDAMTDLGATPGNIQAAIGPAIGPASYEVGPEFPGRFIDMDPENARFFTSAGPSGKRLFDLPGFVAKALREAGVADVFPSPHDTYREEAEFFSYRRATHRREPDYGRSLSLITLDPV